MKIKTAYMHPNHSLRLARRNKLVYNFLTYGFDYIEASVEAADLEEHNYKSGYYKEGV
mgnify:CR=1 FL=1